MVGYEDLGVRGTEIRVGHNLFTGCYNAFLYGATCVLMGVGNRCILSGCCDSLVLFRFFDSAGTGNRDGDCLIYCMNKTCTSPLLDMTPIPDSLSHTLFSLTGGVPTTIASKKISRNVTAGSYKQGSLSNLFCFFPAKREQY